MNWLRERWLTLGAYAVAILVVLGLAGAVAVHKFGDDVADGIRARRAARVEEFD